MLEPSITKNEIKTQQPTKMDEELSADQTTPAMETEMESMQVDNHSMTSASGDEKQHIQMLCDTMKRQIISRAFYGWLAYCRHSKTVRTHLAVLVNETIVPADKPVDASHGVTKELWSSMRNAEGKVTIDKKEFYRLVYYGGVEHSIRSEVWPYLLDHYGYEFDREARDRCDREMRQKYEMIMSEWLAVEAIVRQRDKEISAANLAKHSSESNTSTSEMQVDKSVMPNEVFEDILEVSHSESRKSSAPSVINGGGGGGGGEHEKDDEEVCSLMDNNSNSASDTTTKHSSSRKLVRHKQVESVASFGAGMTASGQNIFITNPSVDQNADTNNNNNNDTKVNNNSMDTLDGMEDNFNNDNACLPVSEAAGSQCVSPASSNGGVYSVSCCCCYQSC